METTKTINYLHVRGWNSGAFWLKTYFKDQLILKIVASEFPNYKLANYFSFGALVLPSIVEISRGITEVYQGG